MKTFLIENHCKFSYDNEIGGLALDCKLSNENRFKITNINAPINEKTSIIKRLGEISSSNSNSSSNNHKRKVELDASNDKSKKHHTNKHNKKTKR